MPEVTGLDLIKWAVAQLDKIGVPPTDGHILSVIRKWRGGDLPPKKEVNK
jgi:hypothetical protein